MNYDFFYNLIKLADSWKQSGNCDPPVYLSIDSYNPCLGHEERQAWAENKCSLILDKSAENQFRDCIPNMESSLLQQYYTQCMFDSCK